MQAEYKGYYLEEGENGSVYVYDSVEAWRGRRWEYVGDNEYLAKMWIDLLVGDARVSIAEPLSTNGGRLEIIRALKEEVVKEIRWKSTKDAGDIWGQEGESSWARAEWGEVKNGMVTLFHGTSSYNLPRILKEGLKLGYWTPPEELEEGEEPQKGVWLAVTPYYAFFYGDTCIRVRVPIEWIDSVNGDEVWLDRDVPPEMIIEVKSIEDWRRNT